MPFAFLLDGRLISCSGPDRDWESALTETGQVELRWRAEPRGVRRVILQIPAGYAVNENIQLAAVRVEPREEAVELACVERELTAPMRVRSHEFLVDAAHRDTEALRRLHAEGARLLHRVLVKVHVGVILFEDVAGPLHGGLVSHDIPV